MTEPQLLYCIKHHVMGSTQCLYNNFYIRRRMKAYR